MVLPSSLRALAEPPVFVVGKERSGTTWVYDILTAHPEVAGVRESWLFARESGLGALLTGPHWADRDPERPAGLSQLMSRDAVIADLRELAARWLALALRPQHRYLAEKSTAHAWVMDEIAAVFPEARFVHVLRDGRDVAVSIHAAATSWAPAWRQTFGSSVRAAAASWSQAVTAIRASTAAGGERFFELRYEDLHADPARACRALFDVCRIPCDDPTLRRIMHETDFGRHRTGETRYRRGGRVGDWRRMLGAEERAEFAGAAGDLLIALGYETDPLWHERPAGVGGSCRSQAGCSGG